MGKIFFGKRFSILLLGLIASGALSGCAANCKEEALSSYASLQFDNALGWAKCAIEQDPKDHASYHILGMAQVMRRDFAGALSTFAKEARLKKDQGAKDLDIIEAYEAHRLYTLGNRSGAISAFGRMEGRLDSLMDDPRARALHGYLFKTYGAALEAEDMEKALRAYNRATALGFNAQEDARRVGAKMDYYAAAKDAESKFAANDLRGAFDSYRRAYGLALKAGVSRRPLLEAIIKTALRLDPAPLIPEEAQRHVSKALTAVRMATGVRDYEAAVAELDRAHEIAPWAGDVFYNRAIVLEKAGKLNEAIEDFKLYLLAAPLASDEKAVKNKVYELEYAIERRETMRREWAGSWTNASPAVMIYEVDGSRTEGAYPKLTFKVGEPEKSGEVSVEVYLYDTKGEKRTGLSAAGWAFTGEAKEGRITANAVLNQPRGTRDCNQSRAMSGKIELLREVDQYSADLSLTIRQVHSCGLNIYWEDMTYIYKGKLTK